MFTPTRAAALKRLRSFVPDIPHYAQRRNFAMEGNQGVSCLSPYIRYRLISEQEVIHKTLETYSFQQAEKFIQEVVWRGYWKGWLERNPDVWNLCIEREEQYRANGAAYFWSDDYKRACQGVTKLAFFNDWMAELVATGYLHNHIRMWFASVWIFTLRIPWQLGAMLMYRYLLDGDPASNTLSWRWVAGLQTKGKSYLASADNITRFSAGRWTPKMGELAESAFVVEADIVTATRRSESAHEELPARPYGVLTTSDDLSIEHDAELMRGAKTLLLLRGDGSLSESLHVVGFIRGAEDDLVHRLGGRAKAVESGAGVLAWAQRYGLSNVVIVAPAVGVNTRRVVDIAKLLSARGIQTSFYQRGWDRELHSLADRGFFPFWERVKKRFERRDPLFYGKSAP